MKNKRNKKHPTAKSDVATSVLEQNADLARENACAVDTHCAESENFGETSTVDETYAPSKQVENLQSADLLRNGAENSAESQTQSADCQRNEGIQVENQTDTTSTCDEAETSAEISAEVTENSAVNEPLAKNSQTQSAACQRNEGIQVENQADTTSTCDEAETSAETSAVVTENSASEPLAKNAKSKKCKERREKKQRKGQKTKEKPQLDEKTILANKLAAIARQQKDIKNWFKLDNAALMYPLVARKESISVFRLAVQLAFPVDPVVLQLAVNDVIARFPSICGCVKNGFFWPYIDRPVVPIVAKEQTKVPGRPMPMDSRRSQIRVNYFQNQIAVEFFHSATDGTGGLIFLNSLLRCYFARLGIDCEKRNCLDHRDTPTVAEFRDNFANIAVAKNPPPCPAVVKSKKLRGTPLKNKKYVTVKGICSASELHALAKSHNATVTEFLCAVQLLALSHFCQVTGNEDERPIRVLVPVNLRKRYNVETIRNFSSYVFFQYNGQTQLDEVLADIAKQRDEQLTDDYFRGMVSFNYNSGNNPLLKIVPLGIKRLVLKAIVSGRGDGIVNCSTFSNLGKVEAPKEFAENVLRYEFTLGKPAKHTNNFTAATFGDVCVIAVTNAFLERDCERYFFSTLANMGLHLALESDVWGDEE